jgi:HlyD family secretion protein
MSRSVTQFARARVGCFLRPGGVLVGALLLLVACNRPPEVVVATVERRDLSASVSSNGRVEPIDPAVLRALFPTFVERVLAFEGQKVRRGELLLELNATEARAELARAQQELIAAQELLRSANAGGPPERLARLESELRKVEAETARLRQQYEALERLLARQAATEDEVARARVALEQVEADLQRLRRERDALAHQAQVDRERAEQMIARAQSEIRSWQEKLRSARLTAPISGTVYSLPVKAGDYVRTGDLLAEVADLAHIRVRAFVDEPELGPLAVGQRVEITWEALPGRRWSGQTTQIPRQVVPRGTRSVGEVLCSIENPAGELLPNTNVYVRIIVEERRQVLVVPRPAVRGEGDQHSVFVVRGGRLERRAVRLGLASTQFYEIREGLQEGEQVALPGAEPLEADMRVTPRKQS